MRMIPLWDTREEAQLCLRPHRSEMDAGEQCGALGFRRTGAVIGNFGDGGG